MTKDYRGYIYKCVSPSGKVYIGQTTTTLEKRWHNGKHYSSKTLFGKAIAKYGWENFVCEAITQVTAPTKEELLNTLGNLEKKYIDKYSSNDGQYGYNVKEGGRHGKLPKEIVEKISLNLKGRSAWNKGKQTGPLSEEHRAKISKANKGKPKPPFSEEHRKKIGLAGLGRTPWNKGLTGKSKYPINQIAQDISNGTSYSKIREKYSIKSSATITQIKKKYNKEYGTEDE